VNNRELAIFEGHTAPIHAAAFSPDGLRVVTGSSDGTVRIWNAGTGSLIAILGVDIYELSKVLFSFDGRWIAAHSSGLAFISESANSVRVWDATTLSESGNFRRPSTTMKDISFSPNGERVFTRLGDKTIRLWDASSGKELGVLARDVEYWDVFGKFSR